MVGGEDDDEVSEISKEQVDGRRFPSVESLEWHMKSHSEGCVSSDDNQEQNRSISEEEKKMSTEEADMRAKEEAALTLMMISRDKTHLAPTSAQHSDENSSAIEKNDGSGEESAKPQVSGSSSESEYEEDSVKTKKRTRTISKKNEMVKLRKCPFCSRVFNSGQALGGHKRTH